MGLSSFQMDIMYFNGIFCVFSYTWFHLTDSVFDRGKPFELIKRYSNLAGDYKYFVDTIPSCLFVIIESVMGTSNENLMNKLLFRHGYQIKFYFICLAVFVFFKDGLNGHESNISAELPHGGSIIKITIMLLYLMVASEKTYQQCDTMPHMGIGKFLQKYEVVKAP